MLVQSQRKNRLFTDDAPWPVVISKLEDNDDVFTKFHKGNGFKLYNEPPQRGVLQEKEAWLQPRKIGIGVLSLCH